MDIKSSAKFSLLTPKDYHLVHVQVDKRVRNGRRKGNGATFLSSAKHGLMNFFYLADRNQTVAPGKGQKERLEDAGLG